MRMLFDPFSKDHSTVIKDGNGKLIKEGSFGGQVLVDLPQGIYFVHYVDKSGEETNRMVFATEVPESLKAWGEN